jgi:hypothetical protein
MPITCEILREGQVILFTFPASFTMADLVGMTESFQKGILGGREEKVHTISDVSAVTQLPRNMLSSGRDLLKNIDPRVGTIFVVTRPGIIRGFADLFTKLFPLGRLVICGTVEEALEAADRLLALEVSQNTAKDSLTPPV